MGHTVDGLSGELIDSVVVYVEYYPFVLCKRQLYSSLFPEPDVDIDFIGLKDLTGMKDMIGVLGFDDNTYD